MPTEPLPYKIAVLCDLRDERGRILLIHRAQEPNKGLCSPIGGKLDIALGESPAQCARREILEEAGVDVPIERLRLIGVVSEQAYQGSTHWLMFVYRVIGSVSVVETTIREGELRWHAPEELDSLPMPETDRHAIWPLILQSHGNLFAVHLDCRGGEVRSIVEQRG